ncbi:dihydroorotate dehydrogenase-like protein [Spirulina major CS-329]|uniref:dihydroorotate dehydrogenase-like protein n=1 Tax=Spirulina TaxID=1154 RepID=UPI00232B6AC3|nr:MULTISPECIES: dihydroorotate dehydrogenase-like protein [Spirulina]MDB9495877.1 dihydroorotate dehydrogenase-like protein [Spirulina subsalsa CS-330]MDB9502049.1 dihydroorotate dehydrogenase-like protein [Spirulina major CS-329]
MDLTTTYLGLTLKSPLVPSAAAPLSEDLDNIKRLEDAGAAAIVLHSIFEEQLSQEEYELHHHLTYGTESFAEALSYFPEPETFHVGAETYLEHIRLAKEMTEIPIIASLNGSTLGGWTHFAQQIEAAGADALELNIYNIPTDPNQTGADVEANYVAIAQAVKAEVSIPVALKLSPFFSNMANMAKQLDETGIDGLVLFNRFYQPDIDIDELVVRPNILLSNPQAMRLPMRWIALLFGRINADLAATSGVQHGRDALKLLMAGAKITQVCSALLRHGIPYLSTIEAEMRHWMEENEYESVRQMQGSMSQVNCPDESTFERVQYMKGIQSYHPDQFTVAP